MDDIRDDILRSVADTTWTAVILADEGGIVAETTAVKETAHEMGLAIDHILPEGSRVKRGDAVMRFRGRPKQVVMAEEVLIGLMAKPSGIATAARRFVERAGNRPRIVAGAWKKMPGCEKERIRRAVALGGAEIRISRSPFLYLDKNYIAMLGGIEASLAAVAHLIGYRKVVQLKGRFGEVSSEALKAARLGADILFVDTGRGEDVDRIAQGLRETGLRDRVRIAFGGNIRLDDLDDLKGRDVDILDIGRCILDASLLDMRLEVLDPKGGIDGAHGT